ncbi:MAG: rhodanese-like domain-containing protein [Deltaproteobacteria bacterium]|nr:rhodanese-like domain-containing protein [Deltaproteobacteria bacterium]
MRGKILASSIVVIMTIFFAGIAQSSEVKEINSGELQEMMNKETKMTIVDIRASGAFNKGHIPGAVNMPYFNAEEQTQKELGSDETIVLVCYGGVMSLDLAKVLKKNGYTDVYSLSGGMGGWNGATVK